MKPEDPKLFIAGPAGSQVVKLVAMVLGLVMVISAVVLGFLVLGVLLALLLVGWIGFSVRRWLQPSRSGARGPARVRPGDALEGEYTVLHKNTRPETSEQERD